MSRPTVAAIMAAACSWRVTISLMRFELRSDSTKSRFSSPAHAQAAALEHINKEQEHAALHMR